MGKRLLIGIIVALALPTIAFVAVEGGASLLLLLRDVTTVPRTERAESRHTTYDAELGWVNVPGARIPDMYGPGIALHTNAQGFRGERDTPPRRPERTVRMVCSGDSFTLGYGVGDGDTWCAQLGRLGQNVETVNMGQGGYGFDQAYLWYRRDAAAMEHDLHLFAFIYDDIRRAKSNRFLGYAKPTLAVVGDSLVVRDVPVPRGSGGGTIRRYLPAVRKLRSMTLVSRLARRGSTDGKAGDASEAAVDSATWRAMRAVFDDLAARNRTKGSTLLLVFLPTTPDHHQEWSTPWRERIAAYAAERGVRFIDLVPDLRSMPRDSLRPLFIQDGQLSFVGASGHYTVAGNRWVAERLRARLDSIAPDAFPFTP